MYSASSHKYNMWILFGSVLMFSAVWDIAMATLLQSRSTAIPCENPQHIHNVANVTGNTKENPMVTEMKEAVQQVTLIYGECLLNPHDASQTEEQHHVKKIEPDTIPNMLDVANELTVFEGLCTKMVTFTQFLMRDLTDESKELNLKNVLNQQQQNISELRELPFNNNSKSYRLGDILYTETKMVQYINKRNLIAELRYPYRNFVEAYTKSTKAYTFETFLQVCNAKSLSKWLAYISQEFHANSPENFIRGNSFVKVLLNKAGNNRTTLTDLARYIKADICEAQLLLCACSAASNVSREAFNASGQRDVNRAFGKFAKALIVADDYIEKNFAS